MHFLEKYLPKKGLVLDAGGGPGRYTIELAKKGYDVVLLRFPGHMAVGVNLSKSAIPQYNYYVDNYYFLETTTEGKPCGFVPNDYRDSASNVTVYPIKSKPLLVHDWENNVLTIFTKSSIQGRQIFKILTPSKPSSLFKSLILKTDLG
jgi:hypothetical protein